MKIILYYKDIVKVPRDFDLSENKIKTLKYFKVERRLLELADTIIYEDRFGDTIVLKDRYDKVSGFSN